MDGEKIVLTFPGLAALAWTVYTFWRTRRDGRTQASQSQIVALETLHLTDAAAFRKELREAYEELRAELRDTNAKLDATESELEKARGEICALRSDISRMVIEKEALGRKNVLVQIENERKEQEISTLRDRVRELEAEVHALRSKVVEIEQHQSQQ